MKPSETLSHEHELITQMLDCLSQAARKLERDERPPRAFFEKAIELSNAFTHKVHHFKEEHVMFGLLAQKKHGEIDSRIESLRQQHDRGRSLMADIGQSLDGYAKGGEIQTSTILESVTAYASLIRRHIHQEDRVFLPLAEQTLSDEEQQYLEKQFEAEQGRGEGLTLEAGHSLFDEMKALL